jgi:hypothetical protein
MTADMLHLKNPPGPMEVRSRHPRARNADGFTSEVYSGITSGLLCGTGGRCRAIRHPSEADVLKLSEVHVSAMYS